MVRGNVYLITIFIKKVLLNKLNKMTKRIKLKDLSMRIVVAVFALILMALGLTGAGIFDVSAYVLPMVKLSAVIILFIEIGLIGIIKAKAKGLDFMTGTELIIGALVALEVVLSLLGNSIATLSALSGWILLIFGIVFAIEAFAR